MGKIVLELQNDTMDDTKKVSYLLTKALVIARKLQLEDFANWCNKELEGYDHKDEKPSYRKINLIYKAWNPYRGFIPVVIQDKKFQETISEQDVDRSIHEIEEYASMSETTLKFSINPELQRIFSEMGNLQFEITAFVGRGQYIRICQQIRKLILDWTIELEKEGILGDDLEFTTTEKEKAKDEIHNYGTMIFGNVTKSDFKSEISHSFNEDSSGASIEEIRSLLDQIVQIKDKSGVDSSELATINSTLEALQLEIEQKVPNPSKVSSLFLSMKSIFENAAGSVIASGIIYEINRLFPV